MKIRELLEKSRVIPVLELDDVDTAADLAEALCEGGASVLEITLRTPAAFEAMEAIKTKVPQAYVGSGTVNTKAQIERCKELDLAFMVSPGLHAPIAEAALKSGIPYLPGVATASDMLAAIDLGLDTLKFFPATAAGGTNMLKALGGPYGDIKFCPTGGINSDNCEEFLSLNNVLCVGGSWVAPKSLIKSQSWDEITRLAKSVNSKPSV